ALFQQQLARFGPRLLELVSRLQLLDNHPIVVINGYYDPLPGDAECLADAGITPGKLDTLHGELAALNDMLQKAATAAGFRYAQPDFDGHGVCSSRPYVQGLKDDAPFHPTAAGQLAIALADLHAL